MKNKKKATFALTVLTTASLLFQPASALAEKIKIRDSVTGEIMIYDTETKKLTKEGTDNPQTPSQPKPDPAPGPEKLPEVPGLFYSDIPVGGPEKVRALKAEGYAVEGRNDVLNDTFALLVFKKENGKTDILLLDKDLKTIHSKGLLNVYMYVPPTVKRPFRVKVDGVVTQFAEVPGTSYVKFASEL